MPMSPPSAPQAGPARQPFVPPPDPLRALSRSLLQLSEHAQQVAPQDLLHQAMQTLQSLVPFDSAWWGDCLLYTSPSPRD